MPAAKSPLTEKAGSERHKKLSVTVKMPAVKSPLTERASSEGHKKLAAAAALKMPSRNSPFVENTTSVEVRACGKKYKHKKMNSESYKSHIFKVLKQVHPDVGISSKAMVIVNSFVNDIFENLADEACKLAKYANKNTVTSREIQAAARLIIPGELSKHA
ncbi:hypothetical protein KI387_039352, partial [Taxus chinensis]